MKDSIFDGYVSGTNAAFGTQSFFSSEGICKGRVFYRIFAGGEYAYRLYFSNTIDSTFADGSCGSPNEPCGEWKIYESSVTVCPRDSCLTSEKFPDTKTLTFSGNVEKTVKPGEVFHSDDVLLSANDGDYLCLEMTFSGEKIPYLPEVFSTIPTFTSRNDGWKPDVKTPGAFLVGCRRDVKRHIAFLGDSITMGCGTTPDAYSYWMSRVADGIGRTFGFWNLGIGYARASDAATDGAWLCKAKQADFVNICLGTNDLLFGRSPEDIIRDLHFIVDTLKESGCEVGIFTAPPFCYTGEARDRWEEVNRRILTEFPAKTAYVYDTCPVLDGDGELHGTGKYGPHPNDEGCRLLAEDFLKFINEKGLFI